MQETKEHGLSQVRKIEACPLGQCLKPGPFFFGTCLNGPYSQRQSQGYIRGSRPGFDTHSSLRFWFWCVTIDGLGGHRNFRMHISTEKKKSVWD